MENQIEKAAKAKSIWSSDKSVLLSLVITWFCAGLLAVCIVAAPFVLPWWFSTYDRAQLAKTVIITFYLCCPMGIVCVVCLLKLLTNIRHELVFTLKNVKLLRHISWCCLLVAMVTVVAMFYYPPFFMVFTASGFLALILRVVKNVMASATELKTENDLTI